jgi:shikimate kinase
MQITENGVAYLYVDKEMQERFDLSSEDASASVSYMDSIKGSLIWIAFIENSDNSTRVRLRSRFVTVSPIAERYHGGGHACAAGATVYSREEADALIAEAAGKSIPEIFAEDGEDAFRRMESDILKRESKEKGRIIITGGGAVTREGNYPTLHQNGRIYEIVRDLDKLALDGRPLSKDRDTLIKMQEIRKPMYEAFRDVIVENDTSPEHTAEKIWRDFCENSGA